jgi:hypothetical protein
MPMFNAPAQGHRLSGVSAMAARALVAATLVFATTEPTIASTRWLRLAQAAAQPAASPPSTQPAEAPAPQGDKDKDKKDEKAGVPATVVDGQQLESVLGIDAVTSKGDDMGRIVDIVVDRTGQVRAAIIDFGGFLGVGSRKIAVDWRMLHFEPKGKPDTVIVDLTRDQLRVAPVYKPGEPVVMLGGAGAKM